MDISILSHIHVGKCNYIINFTSDKYSGLGIQTRRGQSGIAQKTERGSLECCHPHSQRISLHGFHKEKRTVKRATLQ